MVGLDFQQAGAISSAPRCRNGSGKRVAESRSTLLTTRYVSGLSGFS